MAKGVKGKVTASADGGRSGPVTLVDALKRLLPHCEDNPHKVANWLNERHSEGDIRLLANGVGLTATPVTLVWDEAPRPALEHRKGHLSSATLWIR